jgi:hypothetical protein
MYPHGAALNAGVHYFVVKERDLVTESGACPES